MTEQEQDQLSEGFGARADDLDREADEMERQSKDLQSEVRSVDEDWQRKRGDESVPGAQPRQPDERSEPEREGEEEDPE